MEKRPAVFLIALLTLTIFVSGCSEQAGEAFSAPFKNYNIKLQQQTVKITAAQQNNEVAAPPQGSSIQIASQQSGQTVAQPQGSGVAVQQPAPSYQPSPSTASVPSAVSSGIPSMGTSGSSTGSLPSVGGYTTPDAQLGASSETCTDTPVDFSKECKVILKNTECNLKGFVVETTTIECWTRCPAGSQCNANTKTCMCNPTQTNICAANVLTRTQLNSDCSQKRCTSPCESPNQCMNNVCRNPNPQTPPNTAQCTGGQVLNNANRCACPSGSSLVGGVCMSGMAAVPAANACNPPCTGEGKRCVDGVCTTVADVPVTSPPANTPCPSAPCPSGQVCRDGTVCIAY